MRALRTPLLILVALALAATALPAQAIGRRVVRAVLFYSPDCGHCAFTREEVLPPILQEYEGRFELFEVDVTQSAGEQLYHAAVEALDIPPERSAWPTLVVGETVLVGSTEIASQLPGLIDAGVRAGGVEWPAIPGLAEFIAQATPAVTPAAATPAAPATRPVVRAVLFYSDECPHCRVVLDQTLPALQAQYGDQVQFALAELADPANYQMYLQAMQAYAIAPSRQVVPALFIGDRLLTGSEDIPAQLPPLVAAGLASGGVPYPALPDVARLVGPDAPVCAARTPCGHLPAAPEAAGVSSLALAVFAVIAAGVVYAGVTLFSRRPAPTPRAGWQMAVIPLLALGGLAIAGYLTYVEATHVPAACGLISGCGDVQTSGYAYILGIPVAQLGVLGYVTVLAIWAWYTLDRGPRGRLAHLALIGVTLAGTLFSLYLTALEAFVISAACTWCLASAVIMTLLLLFAVTNSD
jgi:uncharacterized membrane protein/thiol-disulfide isomerase/thioredoxin